MSDNPDMSIAESAERLLGALGTAVLLIGPDDRVMYMNASAEALLGASLERSRFKEITTLAHGFGPLMQLSQRARVGRQGYGDTLAIPAPQRDGSELMLAARVSPLEEERTGLLLLELFDITQREQIDRENALVSQHGVSRRILLQLAHEIRNPLGGLRGAAQLLERKIDDPALHEYTNIIIREADRLAELVTELLGPRERPQMQVTNIHEVLEHVATIVCSEFPDLEVLRDYDPSLPPLLMDRDQITQALMNLMRNGAQATDGTGELLLRTRVRTHHLLNQKLWKLVAVIEIEDNGAGVPADIADTIFYPLVSGRAEGHGIGLPLAQELVNRHQGLIEFRSGPGHTVFEVSLPVVSSGEQA